MGPHPTDRGKAGTKWHVITDRAGVPLAWLGRYQRLTVRYERRDDIHQAFLSLGCALICF